MRERVTYRRKHIDLFLYPEMEQYIHLNTDEFQTDSLICFFGFPCL